MRALMEKGKFNELLDAVAEHGIEAVSKLSRQAQLADVNDLGQKWPLSSMMAAKLVNMFTDFDKVEAAVLLHPLLADPRNFESVLSTFETDADR
eukprot:SAG31_NODE_5092_length_2748_cov_1.716874_2_plen_94_part_00